MMGMIDNTKPDFKYGQTVIVIKNNKIIGKGMVYGASENNVMVAFRDGQVMIYPIENVVIEDSLKIE